MIAIVIIIAGVNPTSVDMHVVCGYVCLGMFVIPMAIVAYLIIKGEISDRKENKIRKIKEAEREALSKKYAHLANGLTTWLDDALLQVRWCEYSGDFQINYEHPWEKLCVRCHIGIDGHRKDFYTIGGYKCDFLNEKDMDTFENVKQTLIGRIEDTNAGILFESK